MFCVYVNSSVDVENYMGHAALPILELAVMKDSSVCLFLPSKEKTLTSVLKEFHSARNFKYFAFL